jgi:hypothetical protein
MDVRIDGWVAGLKVHWMDGCMDRCVDDRRKDERMDSVRFGYMDYVLMDRCWMGG